MTALAVGVAAFVAGGSEGVAAHGVPIALAAAAAFAFAGAGNAANDVRDVDVDRVAHPGRPIVTGVVSRRSAVALVFSLYAAAAVAGALVGPWALGLVVAGLVLMESYEVALKRRGFAGNLVVGALTGAPFVLGGIAVGALPATLWALAGLASLATLGREVLKDVEDADADATVGGRRTLPMRVGRETAARVGGAALVAAALLSPAPLVLETLLGWAYLPVVGLADAGFLAAAALSSRAGRAQRLAKASMLLALVAFVAGKAHAEILRGGT